MIRYILAVSLVIASLLVLPISEILPTILAQEDSMTESTTADTNQSTTGNTTESEEDEEDQQFGSISRRRGG